ILEGRRRRVEERREGLRELLARAAERLDAYTLELQRHGLDACEREVRWLEELIANERSGRSPQASPPSDQPERPSRSEREDPRWAPSVSQSSASATAPRRWFEATTTTGTPIRAIAPPV